MQTARPTQTARSDISDRAHRNHDTSKTTREIDDVLPLHAGQMLTERGVDGIREHHTAILASLTTPHRHLPPLEIDVLHPKFETLEHAKAGTVEQRYDQTRHAG